MKNENVELVEVTHIPVFENKNEMNKKNVKSKKREIIDCLKNFKEEFGIALDELIEGKINENDETVIKK